MPGFGQTATQESSPGTAQGSGAGPVEGASRDDANQIPRFAPTGSDTDGSTFDPTATALQDLQGEEGDNDDEQYSAGTEGSNTGNQEVQEEAEMAGRAVVAEVVEENI